MNFLFPVFLKDSDGYMCLIQSMDDLNSHIEMVDVEANEYIGWDIRGSEIRLLPQGQSIEVKVLEKNNDLEKLKSSLLSYANKYLKQNLDLSYFDNHTLESIFQYESKSNMNWLGLKISPFWDFLFCRKKKKTRS